MSSIVVYTLEASLYRAPLVEQMRYYWYPDIQPPVTETNVHRSLLAFHPSSICVNRALFQCPDIQPPVVETNISFLARFVPGKVFVDTSYRWYPDIQPPVIETNVHFLAKFRPVIITVLKALHRNPDIEPPIVETNIHFLAKFKPTQFYSFKFNHRSFDGSLRAVNITEQGAAFDTISVANATSGFGDLPVVRDPWDRDDWGNFIPGSGIRRN